MTDLFYCRFTKIRPHVPPVQRRPVQRTWAPKWRSENSNSPLHLKQKEGFLLPRRNLIIQSRDWTLLKCKFCNIVIYDRNSVQFLDDIFLQVTKVLIRKGLKCAFKWQFLPSKIPFYWSYSRIRIRGKLIQNSTTLNLGPLECYIHVDIFNSSTIFVAITTRWILKQGISRTDSIYSYSGIYTPSSSLCSSSSSSF